MGRLLLLLDAGGPSPDPRMETVAVVAAWIVTVLIGAIGAWILFLIIGGKMNLNQLISEPLPPGAPPGKRCGDASLSRFQFLIFTFIVGMGLLVVIFSQTPPLRFPDIPGNLIGLLGVSGGSYVISKGIQANRDTQLAESTNDGGGTGGTTGGTVVTGGTQ